MFRSIIVAFLSAFTFTLLTQAFTTTSVSIKQVSANTDDNTCLNSNAITTSTSTTTTTTTTTDDSCSASSTSMKRTMTRLASARVIPESKLYVSEPPPQWFGNSGNTPDDPAWTNSNWLKSRFHFSFAEYNNRGNSNFGVMRVCNDDLVQPHRGFGAHPHRDMEIITYIVNGELEHKDSMGNGETLGRGSIQFMTAGTGVQHSESNNGDKPLRFIQTWIVPRARGLAPNYGSYNAGTDCDSKKNQLQNLASDTANELMDTPVKVNQDVNCKAAELELGQTLHVDVRKDRQAYLLCIEGTLEINGKTLTKHDGMEIHGDDDGLEIKAAGVEETENGQVAHFLVFEMAATPSSGRTDM